MSKIVVVIADGVGFRNFVMSNFLTECAVDFEKVIIYSGIPKESYIDNNQFKIHEKNILIRELDIYQEKNKTWFFRKLKEIAHMTLHRNFYGINSNLSRGYPKSNSIRNLVIKFIYLFVKLFHSEKLINFYENRQFKTLKNDKVTKSYLLLLKEDSPNLLFFTHQRPPYLAPILAISKQLGIKTSSFIFSWDNLASKGRMLGEFDSYMVWSKLMKKELLHFYPNTKSKNIYVVGTPQFELYVMGVYQVEKVSFFNKFKLNSKNKLICYSCADAGIGANDEVHIRGVLSYIKKQDINNLQLLVRTSPAEDGIRFEKLKNEFPEIKWNIPKWILTRDNHVENWSQRLPSFEDVVDLKSILSFSDVNVNMLSTMSLDFMLFDKPVINVAFGNSKNGLYDDQKFLNYRHYKYVLDSKAVTIAKNENELHEQLCEALKRPKFRKEYREKLINLEIGAPLEGTSKRIVKALKEFA